MNINTLFNEALLAQATYAKNLVSGMTDTALVNALLDPQNGAPNVTQAQAEYFASKYKVIEQESNPNTGFSATLFQEIKEDGTLGEYHLATRGSAQFNPANPDWYAANLSNLNYGMAYDQVADMLNFYLKLTHSGTVPQFKFTLVNELAEGQEGVPYVSGELLNYLVLIEDGTANGFGISGLNTSTQLSVSGHSLGGHLASAFTLLFPTVTSSTVNNNGVIEPQRQAA